MAAAFVGPFWGSVSIRGRACHPAHKMTADTKLWTDNAFSLRQIRMSPAATGFHLPGE